MREVVGKNLLHIGSTSCGKSAHTFAHHGARRFNDGGGGLQIGGGERCGRACHGLKR